MSRNNTSKRVGLLVFPEVEILDFAGPYEVFTAASRVFLRDHPEEAAPFEVITLAETLAPVKARAGLVVSPDFTLNDHPPIDVLLVPGGVAAGIDMSLHMVRRLVNEALAVKTARQIDIPWSP